MASIVVKIALLAGLVILTFGVIRIGEGMGSLPSGYALLLSFISSPPEASLLRKEPEQKGASKVNWPNR